VPNNVYIGGPRRPLIVKLPVASSMLPATAVVARDFAFFQAESVSGRVCLLGFRDYFGANFTGINGPDMDRYQSYSFAGGDAAQAYVLEPGQRFLWAVAAGTYNTGHEMTIGASGRLTAATFGQTVVAHLLEAGSKGAGDRVPAEVVSFYKRY